VDQDAAGHRGIPPESSSVSKVQESDDGKGGVGTRGGTDKKALVSRKEGETIPGRKKRVPPTRRSIRLKERWKEFRANRGISRESCFEGERITE